MTDFTPKQLAAWLRYERVRVGGKYNMITDGSRARLAARLSSEEYAFCIDNYLALRRLAESIGAEHRAPRQL
mgnify:CR=1 FL=1